MVIEAQKVKNGLFIPLLEPFPSSSSGKIWVKLEWLEQKALEQKHLEGYLRHPVEPGEFSDLEEEQVWPD